jgi:phospholipid-binding lipoprotein MlaA
MTQRTSGLVGAAVLVLALSGCATGKDVYRDPKDPLETYNRGMYAFNDAVDRAVIKPVAQGYKAVTPEPLDRGITNFFNNIADVNSAVNNLLQFKLSRFGSDVGRVATNSTVGILGFFDVATNMGLPSYKEDFGQTFGYWGDVDSPYLVLPLLGPSTVRDTVGKVGDFMVDPFWSVKEREILWGFLALRVVDTRADLLQASKIVETAAVDPYTFVRDAYLQRRRSQIFDGNPPADSFQEDIWADETFQDEGQGASGASSAQ